MNAEAEGSVNGSVCGVKTKEVRILLETESNVVKLPLCEHRHVSCEVVPEADESIQTELRARLGALALGNRRIVDSSKEYTGTNANVRL